MPKDRPKPDGKLSLWPLTPEQAILKALNTPPLKPAKKKTATKKPPKKRGE